MSEAFHPYDVGCMNAFPELLQQFAEAELRSASSIGTYIFHEDYFAQFIERWASDEAMLRRIANYVESLASSEDQEQRNLAEIGILERLVSKEDHRIAPFLGPAAAASVDRVLRHFSVDPQPWRRARKRS
jgi:hypothetical protein